MVEVLGQPDHLEQVDRLLINGDQGWVPGNVFAEIVQGLQEIAAACQDVWMGGARGETLTFSRSHED